MVLESLVAALETDGVALAWNLRPVHLWWFEELVRL
jgi:hypothetical protein